MRHAAALLVGGRLRRVRDMRARPAHIRVVERRVHVSVLVAVISDLRPDTHWVLTGNFISVLPRGIACPLARAAPLPLLRSSEPQSRCSRLTARGRSASCTRKRHPNPLSLLAGQSKLLVERAHGGLHVLGTYHAGYLYRRRAYHLDVDSVAGENLEHVRGHARV